MSTPRKPDTIKHCKACNQQLHRKRFNGVLEANFIFLRRKYCNQLCMAKGMTGVIKVLNERNSRRQSARFRKPDCEICGVKKRRYVHHKDKNPLNNNPSNWQTLCGSCHRRMHSPNYLGTPTQRKPCRHCSKDVVKIGLCNTHLTRQRKYGDPLLTKIKIGSKYLLQKVAG